MPLENPATRKSFNIIRYYENLNTPDPQLLYIKKEQRNMLNFVYGGREGILKLPYVLCLVNIRTLHNTYWYNAGGAVQTCVTPCDFVT